MSDSVSMVLSPSLVGALFGLAGYNLSMAIFHNILIAIPICIIVTIAFPLLYLDSSPRCVYCFGKIAAGAQFCPHCGRIQPKS